MPQTKEKKSKLSPEEKQQKKIEKQQQRVRDQLERESNFVRISIARNKPFQRQLHENALRKQFNDELAAKFQLAAHEMDKRGHTVEVARRHRQHAAEQHLRLFACHTSLIDNLIDLHQIFQHQLHAMYQGERERLIIDFYTEKHQLEKALSDNKRIFENFSHASMALMRSRVKQHEKALIERTFDLRSAFTETSDKMFEKKLKYNQHICDEVIKVYNDFNEMWPERIISEYEKLESNDGVIISEIIQSERELLGFIAEIQKLKMSLDSARVKRKRVHNELGGQYTSMFKYCDSLKLGRNSIEKDTKRLMGALLLTAARRKKSLEKLMDIEGSIQRTLQRCRRYEKLEDLPMYGSDTSTVSVDNDSTTVFTDVLNSVRNAADKKLLSCNELITQSSLNIKPIEESSSDEKPEEEQKFSIKSLFMFSLHQTSFKVGKSDEKPQTVEKRSVRFSPEPSEVSERSDEEVLSDTDNSPASSSSQSSIESSTILDNLHASNFFLKVAQVEADCVELRNYKLTLECTNRQLKEQIEKQQRAHEVEENFKVLNLNRSASVGTIEQFASQITQICDKVGPRPVY